LTVTDTSSIRPLSAPTRSVAVAAELKRLILSGEIAAGTHLRQNEVAKQFAVSTAPVREAFTSLAREGLVRQEANRGVIVFIPSTENLVQNYVIRLALEPLAARIAAEKADDADIQALENLLGEMRIAIVKDVARYGAELNPRFHATLNSAARNPRLADMINQLRDASTAYTQVLALRKQPKRYLDSAQREHEEIVAAIKTHDPERAAEAMTRHLEHNRDQILASLAKQPA
jgi:DNA-binding GntR family transcriptional regulator